MLRKIYPDDPGIPDESFISRIRRRPFTTLVIILCLVNITLAIVNIGIWFMAARQQLFIAADFTNSYTGFKIVNDGLGGQLYDLSFQARIQQEIMGAIEFDGGLLPYLSPPYIALLFSPLANFSLSTAFFIWSLAELGLLIWLVILLNLLFADWLKPERVAMTIGLLAFWPLTLTFMLGQFSLIFTICILQIYIAMRKSKLYNAGIWLVLLSIKPQSMLIPLAMTLNKRYWRVAISAAVTGISLVIISSLALGPSVWLKYIQVLPTMTSYFGKYGFHPDIQYTLRGVFANIFGSEKVDLINQISFVLFIAGFIFTWLIWILDVPALTPRFKLSFAFTFLLSAFLSMHSYPHDDLILVIPAALFYDYLREKDYPRKAYILFILVSPLIFFITEFSSYELFGVIRLPVVTIVVLLIWMGKYLIDEYRSTPKSQDIHSAPIQ